MKTLFFALLFVCGALSDHARAEGDSTLLCLVEEEKGHQKAEYQFRLALPENSIQFHLRLFPKVMVEADVSREAGQAQIHLFVFDYEIDGKQMGELRIGGGNAFNYLSTYTKIRNEKYHSVEISCSLEK